MQNYAECVNDCVKSCRICGEEDKVNGNYGKQKEIIVCKLLPER